MISVLDILYIQLAFVKSLSYAQGVIRLAKLSNSWQVRAILEDGSNMALAVIKGDTVVQW